MKDSEFIELVSRRLKQFGVEPDEDAIRYCWGVSTGRITNFLAVKEVPEGLLVEQAEEVAGEVLKLLYSIGRIENIDGVVSSVKEGDTTVTFGTSASPEAKFNEIVNGMRISDRSLLRYRRMTW